MRIIQQTLSLRKDDTIETVRGEIPAHQWLENEATRIGKNASRVVEIRPVGVGRKALFVDDVGIEQKGGYSKGRTLLRSETR